MKFVKQLLFHLNSLAFVISSCSPPIVKISQGTLQGCYKNTVKGKKYSSFTGIPYAQPPVGKLRFKMAQPAEPWEETFDATKAHNVCPQTRSYFADLNVIGNEDCLYLNVYTPVTDFATCDNDGDDDKLLPVLLFLHGLGFLTGSANYKNCNPNILLDRDIILVVPNFRLGALGFISTGDEIAPGNNGLKDQSLAIKWVTNNIENFGGNPEKITLFGQSSGAVSAHLHMFSPMSQHLINRVICESGTALSPWALSRNEQTQNNSRVLATFFGCLTRCSQHMLACLRKISAYEIVKQQDLLFYEWDMDPMVPFRPVVEPLVKEAFLTEQPEDIIRADKTAKVELIIGLNLADGAFKSSPLFAYQEYIDTFKANFYSIAPVSLLYKDIVSDLYSATHEIANYYFKTNDKTCWNYSRKGITKMYTDALFLYPAYTAVELHFKYTNDRVYYYAFDYQGSISYSTKFGEANYNYGTCHCDELIYLFDHRKCVPNYEPSENDKKMSFTLTKMWTRFAKTGYPTPRIKCNITKWNPVHSDDLDYYLINNTEKAYMLKRLLWPRVHFWKAWYKKYSQI